MIRGIIIWIAVAAVVYAYRSVLSRKQKRITKRTTKDLIVPSIAATLITSAVYLINNLQGI